MSVRIWALMNAIPSNAAPGVRLVDLIEKREEQVGKRRRDWGRKRSCEYIGCTCAFYFRIQEQLLFKRLMACHSLAKEQLNHPISLNERYVHPNNLPSLKNISLSFKRVSLT